MTVSSECWFVQLVVFAYLFLCLFCSAFAGSPLAFFLRVFLSGLFARSSFCYFTGSLSGCFMLVVQYFFAICLRRFYKVDIFYDVYEFYCFQKCNPSAYAPMATTVCWHLRVLFFVMFMAVGAILFVVVALVEQRRGTS